MKNRIEKLSATERQMVRRAVGLAVRFWPSQRATRRAHLRQAFQRLRFWTPAVGLLPAIDRVELDAYRHSGV